MTVELLVLILLFFVQIILSIYSKFLNYKLQFRYRFETSSGVEPVELLEKYSRIYQKINLKVNAQISQPAIAINNLVLVNRNEMYKPTLYNNFIVSLSLVEAKIAKVIQRIHTFQSVIFLVQLLNFTLAFNISSVSYSYFVFGGIALVIFQLLLSTMVLFYKRGLLLRALEITQDLAELTQEEVETLLDLISNLQFTPFEYPINLLTSIVLFFIP